MTQDAAGSRIDRDLLTRVAASAARSVPGVTRLQPDLKHLVGRAARDVFARVVPSTTEDRGSAAEEEPSGVDVDRLAGGVQVTVRVVTATTPPPHVTALQVQRAVSAAVADIGPAAQVTVIVVDVDP